MNFILNTGLAIIVRVYVAVVLVVATILSPLASSFIPGLALIWYLYLWRWPLSAEINLLTDYFTFAAIVLLLSTNVGPFFALLIALPVLLLVTQGLEKAAESAARQDATHRRRPTSLGVTLLSIAIVLMSVSWLLGSVPLALACAVMFAYFAALGTAALRGMPTKPVEETHVHQRMVAGSKGELRIGLTSKTRIGGRLFLDSPYEWLKVSPGVLPLKRDSLAVDVSLSPVLSGASIVKLKGMTLDRWGLFQTSFELAPIDLYVIPRARYAAWLARRYLSQSKMGTLPLVSNIEAMRPIYGLRRGVEYYGSQLYQPGDSLKNIDWKHSLKQGELITKEFTEFQGQPAVVLVNLAVGNSAEADKLAYNIIVTALSLAQENIPAALAAYDDTAVKLTTTTLQGGQLLMQSLQLAQEMVTTVNPARYLNAPDVGRLRGNISRLRSAGGDAAKVLFELLQIEYVNLTNTAKTNPATKALTEVFGKVDKQANIVVISHRNHDAEALAFNTFNLTRKGNAVIAV